MATLFEEKKYQPQAIRDYQEGAITAVFQAWEREIEAPLAALATGGGKTTIFSELLRRRIDPTKERALVIAHTEEIITQIRDRIANQFGGALDGHFGDRYAPGIGIVMAESDAADARIVVATRQSLHKSRLEKVLLYGKIDVLAIDEAHHAGPGTTYLDIVATVRKHNPSVQVVGFTATPQRTDGHALGALWSEIVYEWLIPDGIKGGYLVPPTRIKITTNVDLSKVKSSHGDYNAAKMVSVLDTANWEALSMRAYMEHIHLTGRPTLAFMPNVEMSRTFVSLLKREGIAAAHIDGETPKDERRKILADYTAGKLQVISNFGVLTEGFDAPKTAAILMGRPTRSPTLFTQIIGRGLRPYPGKSDCIIVDLTVVDVKALEYGTLVGRMTMCKGCGCEHYAGLKACPRCGFVRPPRTRAIEGAPVEEGELSYGDQLLVNYESVFAKAFAAWYVGEDGFFSCTLSFEDGAYIIAPPLEDNYYRLIHVHKDSARKPAVISRNEDLSSLMLDADERVRKMANMSNDKNAGWREHPASMGQINLLSKLKVPVGEGLSKGAASQLITHHLAVRQIVQVS